MTVKTNLKDRLVATHPEVRSVVVDRDADLHGLPATAVTVVRLREDGRITEEVITIAKKNHVTEDHAFAIVDSYLH